MGRDQLLRRCHGGTPDGLGLEPIAALPFTVRIDFEGDQWTFFKFPHSDLVDLFRVEIQELNRGEVSWITSPNRYRSGDPYWSEVDSYFLPDTAATTYKREHVKSTVAVNEIDIEGAT